MGEERQDFVLYMCFETDQDDGIPQSMAIVSDQSGIEKWKSEQRTTGSLEDNSGTDDEVLESSTSEALSEKLVEDPSNELSKLMTRFHETMSSYRPLVRFGMRFMPTMRSHFVYNEIYKNANRQLEIVEHDLQFRTFGITEDQYPSMKTQIRRLREFDRGVTVLPGAILLSLAATFDSFIADTLRIMLRRKPERVIESSKTISVKEVLNMASFEDVIGKITEDEVEKLMRGSHDEQVKYIEDKLDIRIRSNYHEWGEFVEIFERRNLIAHGNYIINSHYILNCNKHGFTVTDSQLGERLSLDGRYLRESSDRLLEFGLSLMFVLWLKHFRDSKEKAYGILSDLTYELIKDGQSGVAASLLHLALFKQKANASDRTRRTMTVNLANAYKKLGDDEKAHEVITEVDWSAATDDFQICVAAIQGNIERVVELMPKVAQTELFKKSYFRDWPVFDWAREQETVRAKFHEIYGEPIIDLADEENTNRQESTRPMKE